MMIVGAGMSGLLAANMLIRKKPYIIEAQEQLPNNHSAVLRFRSSVVGDVLGIPFREVQMIKAPVPWRNPVSDSLAYSYKCTGEYRSDRSITSGLVSETRYIAPTNLIERMAEGVSIKYDTEFVTPRHNNSEPIISTLPMPVLMNILQYTDIIPRFTYTEGYNIKARIKDCDAFISLLVPDPKVPFSRVSITGDELIIEIPKITKEVQLPELLVSYAVEVLLGMDAHNVTDVTVHKQSYEKITPIDDDERKRFIAWATDHHNVYSLGRYATWRPNLLLDDLVKDIRKIEVWIRKPDIYSMRKYRNK
jgi:hypothetical protein